ncbi:MAG: hypothetical protein FJ098_02865, partial [Deltaproteobacteria bacterium]|nr:hypothetical protein [Deltaproteobacteria bacterium]
MPRPVLLCVLALGLAACGRGPEPDEAADARRMMRVRPEEPGTAPETSPVPPPAVTPPAAAEAPAPEGRSAKAARAPHSREETGRPPAPPVPVPPLQLLDPPPAAAASEPRDFPDFAGVYEAASRSVIALEVS